MTAIVYFKTLEEVARLLLNKKISFIYEPTFIRVVYWGDADGAFSNVSYHTDTRAVVFMNDSFDEVNHFIAKKSLL